MIWALRRLGLAIAFVVTALAAPPAQAATPYQGVYTILDPYTPGTLTNLQNAAHASCVKGQQSSVSPFCSASNGILLRIPWCDFQLYHLTNPQGQPYTSCHYWLQFSGLVGSKGQQTGFGDQISPCAGTYDTCSGPQTSILGAVLRQIVRIDNARAAIGLPPLNLSVGMFAGAGTPQTLFDTVGFLDVPNNTAANSPNTEECMRLPLSWKPQFLSAYEKALDTLIAYIQQEMSQDANITIVKPAAITSQDIEVEMPGLITTIATPVDPGPAGIGGVVNCQSNNPSAQLWLNAYNQQPNYNQNFSQANESAYGSVIGHIWATLKNSGLSSAILSIPTEGGQAFANVDCGTNGNSSCSVQTASAGDYSVYYLELYTDDLFNGGLAYQAAASAYTAMRTDSFVLSPLQLSTNSTSLSPTPIVASQQVPCNLNNTNPADDAQFTLNSQTINLPGAGTVIAYQTAANSGSLCSSNQYQQTLNNGVNQGALFLEVGSDAAISNLQQCSPYLTNALTQIMSVNAPTTCTY